MTDRREQHLAALKTFFLSFLQIPTFPFPGVEGQAHTPVSLCTTYKAGGREPHDRLISYLPPINSEAGGHDSCTVRQGGSSPSNK